MKTIKFDFIILGGGLIGKSLGLALKKLGLHFAIIDKNAKSNFSSDKTETATLQLQSRALALSYSTLQFLDAIQVPLKQGTAILEVQVSSQGQFGLTRLQASEFSVPALASVVPADCLEHALDDSLSKTPITFFRPAEMVGLVRQENHWEIRLNTDMTIHTPLIISAEGSHSKLAEYLNIEIQRQDYQQTALVFNLPLSQDHQNIAYERFTKMGVLAFLPFGHKQVKCVWSVSKLEATRLLSLSSAEFLQALQKQFGYRLGSFAQCSAIHSYPLIGSSAEQLYGAGWLMIGNAANTLHPVAAQGYNLGVRDVATLAEIIIQCYQQARILGLQDLQLYDRLRRPDQRQSQFFTRTLATLDTIPQSLGILACEWLPFIKQNIGKQGLGQKSFLPKLCRGISL